MCFYYVPRSLAVIALDDVSGPFSPHYPFPLAKLNWNTFCRLKNTVKTLWIPCAAVWQPTNAGVLLQTQRGASQQTCRPTKTESCLNTYFHWEGGRGGPASFNQDLKTGEPLIKSRLCTFILFLSRLCWLVSAALILRPWSVVSDLSLLPITRWSSCDVEKETSKNPWPRLPLLTATSKWACVVCCSSYVFFFPPCWETAINFPSAVANITSWVKRSCDRALPDYVRGQPLFNLDMFLVMWPNPAAGFLADVMPERFGIMLIGTVLNFNVCVSRQSTPGSAKKSPFARMKLSITIDNHQTDLCLKTWTISCTRVHVLAWPAIHLIHSGIFCKTYIDCPGSLIS